MASRSYLSILALASSAIASTNNQITWGTVSFTYHGEKSPDFASAGYTLSPLGANQLLLAGQTMRQRYVSSSTNLSTEAPISGLSVADIDNSQIEILSTDDEFVSASALAFMQGLYPPVGGVVVDEETLLSNMTVENWPLGGYQYPNIGTVSPLDLNSIWVDGSTDCTTYSEAQLQLLSQGSFNAQVSATADFYNNLASSVFSGLASDVVNYYNAYELYEYALYQYNHNSTVYQSLQPSDLDQLYNLASEQQFEFNSPNAAGGISSITGQTFASKVVQQFTEILASGGVSDKMTLMFGSFEPVIAFFALSGLSSSSISPQFASLPLHGSTMIFELFSYPTATDGPGSPTNENTTFPSADKLWVRFLFRNGTADDTKLISYSLFERGNSQVDMSYADFIAGMEQFAINDVSTWCSACEAITLFCEALEDNTATATEPTATSKKAISPAVAGVIGAIVTLAVFALLGLLLMIFGFRLAKRNKNDEAPGLGVLRRSGSGGGGFKGAEKLASDTDLRIKTGGAGASVIRHERVGSWELGETPAGQTPNALDKEIEGGRVVSTADYGRRRSEDRMDPFGDPVKAAEHV